MGVDEEPSVVMNDSTSVHLSSVGSVPSTVEPSLATSSETTDSMFRKRNNFAVTQEQEAGMIHRRDERLGVYSNDLNFQSSTQEFVKLLREKEPYSLAVAKFRSRPRTALQIELEDSWKVFETADFSTIAQWNLLDRWQRTKTPDGPAAQRRQRRLEEQRRAQTDDGHLDALQRRATRQETLLEERPATAPVKLRVRSLEPRVDRSYVQWSMHQPFPVPLTDHLLEPDGPAAKRVLERAAEQKRLAQAQLASRNDLVPEAPQKGTLAALVAKRRLQRARRYYADIHHQLDDLYGEPLEKKMSHFEKARRDRKDQKRRHLVEQAKRQRMATVASAEASQRRNSSFLITVSDYARRASAAVKLEVNAARRVSAAVVHDVTDHINSVRRSSFRRPSNSSFSSKALHLLDGPRRMLHHRPSVAATTEDDALSEKPPISDDDGVDVAPDEPPVENEPPPRPKRRMPKREPSFQQVVEQHESPPPENPRRRSSVSMKRVATLLTVVQGLPGIITTWRRNRRIRRRKARVGCESSLNFEERQQLRREEARRRTLRARSVRLIKYIRWQPRRLARNVIREIKAARVPKPIVRTALRTTEAFVMASQRLVLAYVSAYFVLKKISHIVTIRWFSEARFTYDDLVSAVLEGRSEEISVMFLDKWAGLKAETQTPDGKPMLMVAMQRALDLDGRLLALLKDGGSAREAYNDLKRRKSQLTVTDRVQRLLSSAAPVYTDDKPEDLFVQSEAQTRVLDVLARYGANVNAQQDPRKCDGDAWCLLHIAASYDNVERSKWLAEKGAILDLATQKGQTPLMIAAHNHATATLHLLLNFGAKIHLSDFDGWTALHYAAAAGADHACELLLRSGASKVSRTIEDLLTPADLAKNSGRMPTYWLITLFSEPEIPPKEIFRLLLDGDSDDDLPSEETTQADILRVHD